MPSSVISSMNYNADTLTLRVFFVSGVIYDYLNVPINIYERMKNAMSKGTFLNQVIKKRFRFRKVIKKPNI